MKGGDVSFLRKQESRYLVPPKSPPPGLSHQERGEERPPPFGENVIKVFIIAARKPQDYGPIPERPWNWGLSGGGRPDRLAEAESSGKRGCDTRAAARTVAKPFRFTKVPVGWGFWQSGGRRLVVHRAKNGISEQPLRQTGLIGREGGQKSGYWQGDEPAGSSGGGSPLSSKPCCR